MLNSKAVKMKNDKLPWRLPSQKAANKWNGRKILFEIFYVKITNWTSAIFWIFISERADLF